MKKLVAASGLLLLATLSFPAFAQNATMNANSPEVKELDTDAGKAGTTAAEAGQYLKSLPADRQAKIKAACTYVMGQPASEQRPKAATFCKNVQGAGM